MIQRCELNLSSGPGPHVHFQKHANRLLGQKKTELLQCECFQRFCFAACKQETGVVFVLSFRKICLWDVPSKATVDQSQTEPKQCWLEPYYMCPDKYASPLPLQEASDGIFLPFTNLISQLNSPEVAHGGVVVVSTVAS